VAPRVRIGAVAYLNTRPLVWGLERGLAAERIELSYAVPAVLAQQMRAGALDVALLPVVELGALDDVEIVPGLGIVTRGAARSVLLVTRKPLDAVERVALDPESRTSNALVRLLFAEVWGAAPRFEPGTRELDAALDGADAAVRIGDKALFEALPAGCSAIDLGQAWTAATGLPFVFAAWIARPGVIDRGIYAALHESRRGGSKALRAIAEAYAFEGHRDPRTALDYLTHNIVFRLGAAELRALERFLAGCARLGLIERVPPLRFALSRTTACHEVAAMRSPR